MGLASAGPPDTGGEDAPGLRSVTVALDGSDVVLSWASREALMQRLQGISERSHIRARFDPDGASPVELTPAQRARLLVILDEWRETMTQELLEFRNALITDVRCRKKGRRESVSGSELVPE